ncbi:MAG: hypothetical protein M5U26_07660 [Planctomycetota bacterium]|nr:hypothetical protein [Planctomycetota bacterium]
MVRGLSARAALLGLLVLLPAAARAEDGARTVEQVRAGQERYRDIPKGVVLEGAAAGLDAVTAVDFDKKTDTFLINGKLKYVLPISRGDFKRLFKNVCEDDRLGVTLVDGEPRTYGKFSTGSRFARDLVETDRFLGGIVYGLENLLGDVKLPGGYKPKKTEGRQTLVVAFTTFKDFAFEAKDGALAFSGCTMDIQLVPIRTDKRSEQGGHLADLEAQQGFVMEPGDRDNINHLKSYQADYFKMDQFKDTIAWGCAAAFARAVRDSKIDREAFLKLVD